MVSCRFPLNQSSELKFDGYHGDSRRMDAILADTKELTRPLAKKKKQGFWLCLTRLQILQEFHGISMQFHGISMEFHVILMEFHGISMEFHVIWMEFHGFQWSFMGFQWDFNGVIWDFNGV